MSNVCVFEPLGENMDMKKLIFEASLEGSVSSLLGLLREDPLILDRDIILSPYNETPLHVASMLGHLDFVREVLRQKPELATELNSRRSSPLHLASAKGYVEIVKELILVSPDTCLARDRDGRNPVHLAAMKGRIDVLKELLRARVHAARAMAHRNETILHLCVKHNQIEALKLLVETLSNHEFVNSKDDDGHTILHLAAADKQIETIKFLLRNTTIEVNEPNADGVTAMGVLALSQRDVNDKEIKENLTSAGAIEENRNNSKQTQTHTETLLSRRDLALLEPPASKKKIVENGPKNQEKWLEEKQSTLMVVASLIATMAFQVGVNPPGGVWQDTNDNHKAGYSIMASNASSTYNMMVITNTVSFIASLSIILLLISGLPIKRRIFMFILMVIMWITVTSTSLTYLLAMITLSYGLDSDAPFLVMVNTVVQVTWELLLVIIILIHVIRLIIKGIPKLRNYYNSQRRGRLSRFTTNHDGV